MAAPRARGWPPGATSVAQDGRPGRCVCGAPRRGSSAGAGSWRRAEVDPSGDPRVPAQVAWLGHTFRCQQVRNVSNTACDPKTLLSNLRRHRNPFPDSLSARLGSVLRGQGVRLAAGLEQTDLLDPAGPLSTARALEGQGGARPDPQLRLEVILPVRVWCLTEMGTAYLLLIW